MTQIPTDEEQQAMEISAMSDQELQAYLIEVVEIGYAFRADETLRILLELSARILSGLNCKSDEYQDWLDVFNRCQAMGLASAESDQAITLH